ncbi:MAG: hypothetical protein ACJ8H8_11510 [Geminicoccaceae bacterium]
MLTKRHLAAARATPLLGLLTLAACATQDEVQTVYCYRTLADVSCYTGPDPGRESRLVGTYRRETGSIGADQSVPPRDGAVTRVIGATLDLAGRLVSPIGSIIGLVVNP